MGFLPDDTPVDQMLKEEIVITQEVRTKALDWKRKGAIGSLVYQTSRMKLSIPNNNLEARGYPIDPSRRNSHHWSIIMAYHSWYECIPRVRTSLFNL